MGKVMAVIANNYDNLLNKFKRQIISCGFEFDYDIFMDTLLKCDKALEKKEILNSDIERYLWKSFKTNMIQNRQRNVCDIGIPNDYDIEDNNYDTRVDQIETVIIERFGSNLYGLFVEHIQGKSYEDMAPDIPNIKYKFRKIREFIRQHLN